MSLSTMKRFSQILLALAIAMILLPFPVFIFLVVPYAETTRDPDAIEAVAWFSGIFLMLVGMLLVPVALGIRFHVQNSSP